MLSIKTPCPAPPSTHHMDGWLAGLVARDPHALALSWCDPTLKGLVWETLSRAELARQVTRCAHRLVEEHGVLAGQRVAWLGHSHPAMLVLLLALARCGGILVPLNHRLSPAEWQAVLADCQPALLVHDSPFATAAQRLAAQVPPLHLEGLMDPSSRPSDDRATAPRDGQAPLLLVYTSGTTGLPKAAVHTEANLLANMAIAAQVQDMSERDTVLTVLPLFHVGGLCIQTLPALSVGAHVRLFARFDAGATLECIARDRPTLTLQVPATLKALTEHPQWAETDLSSLHAVWAGSSLLPPAPLAAFHARGVPVCNVYGSTETGPFSIALPPEHAQSHAGSCGWPAPGVEVQLRDTSGAAVGTGAVGEICVRGPNVVRHYWPDRPACDTDGFFHSGDLGQQAPDGSFTVAGRAKDMVISGGENIYPAEIENLLLQHPLVADCAVLGQADAQWSEVVAAVLVLHAAADAGGEWVASLQAFLDGRLARYKWPHRWLRVDALPKTALGKVQKEALRKLLDGPAAA